jgi:2-polyprenyl-6-methoxyphenol hydroxylase-like FAD-dependent oxidoreductase
MTSADGLSTRAVNDVVIVGGGIAGLAAAIALGRRGVRTTVVERDGRTTGASIGFQYRPLYALRELDLMDRVMERGTPRFLSEDQRSTPVFGQDGARESVPYAQLDDDWEAPLGIAIYRPVLAEIMRDAAREAGAELLIGHSCRSIQQQGDGVTVEVTTGTSRRFDLLVGADGINSDVRANFFPEAGGPIYTGSMSFRAILSNAPANWRAGLHVVDGGVVRTNQLPGNLFYVALPSHMARRHVGQDEARSIMRETLARYAANPVMAEVRDAITEDVEVIVGPFEWILVPPPWFKDRVVLVGDAAHATAPTIGSGGGMALEDGVVLAQELTRTDQLKSALTAYSERRQERTKLVVETSVELMRGEQSGRPRSEWAEIRAMTFQKLAEAY